MDPAELDIPGAATCTTCQFAEDFSNYWTAVLFFRARNGTYHRVPQKGNVFFEQANGGMTVYYTPTYTGGQVTAFKPVRCFRPPPPPLSQVPCGSSRASAETN